MILLDTNVLSELMREAANERVLAWLSRQASSSLCKRCTQPIPQPASAVPGAA